jgi:hypothetical protein
MGGIVLGSGGGTRRMGGVAGGMEIERGIEIEKGIELESGDRSDQVS